MAKTLIIACTLFVWLLLFEDFLCISEDQNEILPEKNAVNIDNEPLLLTPLIEAGKIKEAQHAAEVTEISEMANTKSYSGYLTVNKKFNSNMFFWFFPAQNNSQDAPVVLWLQGGPGRSSLRGLLMENGPFDIGTGVLEKRNASWTEDHSIIYLDSPVGAGFSYSSLEGHHTTTAAIGEDLYTAILQFFQLFPNLQKNDFFVAGQSYGGKYVPTIAHLIHRKNHESKQKINLVGIAIGNGLVDPERQLIYSEFLYQIGLINAKGKKELKVFEQKMIEQARNRNWKEAYMTYSEIVLNARKSLFKRLTGFVNINNLLEPIPSIEKELEMGRYISQPAVRRAIHAGNQIFNTYSGFIQLLLRDDLIKSVAPLLSELIDNYKVLIYNGQLDIIIPYRTTVDYLTKLTFKGVEQYEDAEREKWYVNGILAGYVTKVGNLTEIMVRNAGHSVTEDQIVWATDMLYRFTRNLSFKTDTNI